MPTRKLRKPENETERMPVLSFLDLCPDATRIILAMLSLVDFQRWYSSEVERKERHRCTFRQRYLLRYGQRFPELSGVEFARRDRKQTEYLFAAGWFHGEIGFCSHLVLPISQCLRGTVLADDPKLVRYFCRRTTQLPDDSLRLAAEKGDSEMLKAVLPRFEHSRCGALEGVSVPTTAAVRLLLESRYASGVTFGLGRRFLLDEVKGLMEEFQANGKWKTSWTLSVCQGLLASAEPEKIAAAEEMLCSRALLDADYDVYYLHAYAERDDVPLFRKLWAKLKRRLQPPHTNFCVVEMLAQVGALRILRWLHEHEGPEFMASVVIRDTDRIYSMETDDGRFRIRPHPHPERVGGVIDFLLAHVPHFDQSHLFAELCCSIGDRRLLTLDEEILEEVFVGERLFDLGHHELLRELVLQFDVTVVDRPGLIRFFIRHHLPTSMIRVRNDLDHLAGAGSVLGSA